MASCSVSLYITSVEGPLVRVLSVLWAAPYLSVSFPPTGHPLPLVDSPVGKPDGRQTGIGKRVGPALGCVKHVSAARGGQDMVITKPRVHSLADPSTEQRKKVGTWLRDISSWPCLAVTWQNFQTFCHSPVHTELRKSLCKSC